MFSREHCSHNGYGWVKDLEILGKDLSSVIILDN